MAYKPVTAERIAKLPKWAQSHIRLLKKNLEFEQEKLRQIDTADTPIRWEYSGRRDAWHGIPTRAILRFDLIRGTVEVTLRHGVLLLRNYGNGRIMVQPSDHNGIEVNIEPRETTDASALLELLREMEAADQYQDMEDSGITKCVRCDMPVGEHHLQKCPYFVLPRLAS